MSGHFSFSFLVRYQLHTRRSQHTHTQLSSMFNNIQIQYVSQLQRY